MSANGQLAASELAPIPGGRLRKDAAAAFNAMNAASKARFGVGISIRDSYRPLGRPGDLDRGVWSQWAAWERYQRGGNLAAHPGTSNHGWGTAIDLTTEVDRHRLDQIGSGYGFSKSWSDASGEWWHVLYQPGHFKPRPKPKPLHWGDKGLKVLGLSSRLRNCGYLWRPYWRFGRPVHGAVIRFQKHHRLTPDGQVGPITDKVLTQSSNWCKKHHRHEV